MAGVGGGVPWVQIIENEFECCADRMGLRGYFSKEFGKKDYS